MANKATNILRTDEVIQEIREYLRDQFQAPSFWELSETSGPGAEDSIRSFDGAYQNGPELSQRSIIRADKPVARFNVEGNNQHCLMDNPAMFPTSGGDWTLGVFFRAHRDAPDAQNLFFDCAAPSGSVQFWADFSGGGTCSSFVSGSSNNFTGGSISVSREETHLATLTIDKSDDEIRTYIDGQLNATDSLSGITGVSDLNALYLGTRNDIANIFHGFLGPCFFLTGKAIEQPEVGQIHKLSRGEV